MSKSNDTPDIIPHAVLAAARNRRPQAVIIRGSGAPVNVEDGKKFQEELQRLKEFLSRTTLDGLQGLCDAQWPPKRLDLVLGGFLDCCPDWQSYNHGDVYLTIRNMIQADPQSPRPEKSRNPGVFRSGA